MSITLAELPKVVARAVRTGTNIHAVGEPGIGKTAVLEQTAKRFQENDPEFIFLPLYTPSLSPVDFVAFMPDAKTDMLKPYRNSQLPNAYDDPDARGIVFLGERDNADPATNKALQKYINNEDMGGLRKPAGVIVVSDSNELDHRSGVVQQSLALVARSQLVEVTVDADVTLKYFNDTGVNSYVQAYLSLRKAMVSNFQEAIVKPRKYGVWANPRSWERLGRHLDDADAHGEQLSADEIIGNVGEGAGREFAGFLHAARELVSYEDIVAKPKKAPWPEKLSDQYAVIAMLSHSVKSDDFANVRTYMEREGVEKQVLFLRLLMSSKGQHKLPCTKTQAYTSWFANESLRKAVLG